MNPRSQPPRASEALSHSARRREAETIRNASAAMVRSGRMRGDVRSVRPLTHGNVELGHWRRIEGHGKDGRVRLIGAPRRGIDAWKLKHHVGNVMVTPIG